MRRIVIILAVLLPLADLVWNLTHLNVGLRDFFALSAFAHGLVANGAWPATPYFPAGYPLLLIPGGLLGSTLIWGYFLSAVGCFLGLTGLARLLDVLEVEPKYQTLAVAAAWLMPVWRIPAGCPSVDMLYTGLGIWFIAGAIYLWRREDSSVGQRWVHWSLLAAPALLAFLRYHALVLLVPVLLILLWKTHGKLRLLHHALLVVAAVTAVNHLIPLAVTGSPLPSVVGIQIRSGIEFDHAIDYETPDSIFQDYRNFAEETRAMSVVEHYGLPLVAKHTLKGWLKFLRRPAIALGLLLVFGALVFRRRLPAGIGILALWIPLYCLCLSPAYYTPRSTTLPALVAVGICFLLALQFFEINRRSLVAGSLLLLLICGYSVSSSYCWLIFQERMNFSKLSFLTDKHLQTSFKTNSTWWPGNNIVSTDDRIFCTTVRNPWCIPFPNSSGSWTMDPAINSTQIPEIVNIDMDQDAVSLAASLSNFKLLILYPYDLNSSVALKLEGLDGWGFGTKHGDLQYLTKWH